MKTNSYNRKKREFIHLARRVNQLILSGEWVNLTASSRNKIIVKLNALYRQICLFFSQVELKKILAAAAIFIGFPLALHSQSFDPPVMNPYGLVPDTANFASPAFADIDNDGDLDLFTGNYTDYEASIQFFENTGTATAPNFALPEANPFGITLPGVYFAFPAFADIDQDGDFDLFLGGLVDEEYGGGVLYYQNTGTATAASFAAPQINPFGLVNTYMFAIPEFADLDDDGDLDLFVGEGYANFQFFENTGTETAPDFAAPVQNPFGLTAVSYIGAPAFADIDQDGDLDLFVGEYYGSTIYFQNTGNAGSPAFATPVSNPFELIPTNYYNFPKFADLDDDGDMDLMAGEVYGNFKYFKNTSTGIGIAENNDIPLFDLFPNPALDDVNIILNQEYALNRAEISISDINGRQVSSAAVNTDALRLKTENLKPGVYFIRLTGNGKTCTRKLIIR